MQRRPEPPHHSSGFSSLIRWFLSATSSYFLESTIIQFVGKTLIRGSGGFLARQLYRAPYNLFSICYLAALGNSTTVISPQQQGWVGRYLVNPVLEEKAAKAGRDWAEYVLFGFMVVLSRLLLALLELAITKIYSGLKFIVTKSWHALMRRERQERGVPAPENRAVLKKTAASAGAHVMPRSYVPVCETVRTVRKRSFSLDSFDGKIDVTFLKDKKPNL